MKIDIHPNKNLLDDSANCYDEFLKQQQDEPDRSKGHYMALYCVVFGLMELMHIESVSLEGNELFKLALPPEPLVIEPGKKN